MTITNIFDAIREGTFKEFENHYEGNVDFVL
jgi:hypothetical protein